jgi:hypothetical protein
MEKKVSENWHAESSWMMRFETYLPELVYGSMESLQHSQWWQVQPEPTSQSMLF